MTYFLDDLVDFWYYAYKELVDIDFNEDEKTKTNIIEFTNSFESMIDIINIIIQRKNSHKNKNLSVLSLIESWKLFALKEIQEKKIKLKPFKYHSILMEKKAGCRNAVAYLNKKYYFDEGDGIESVNRFADENGFIDINCKKSIY